MKFHLIGIGGAGMSVVAQMLASEGHQVAGSDRADSPTLQQLREAGITVYVGQRASNVDPDATVVVSSAIRADNPELAQATARGQEIWHRSQALAFASRSQDFIAVAGAHGKTTTSAMLATILVHCDLDPSFAIGSVLPEFNSGARVGSGSVCVAEADESDGSFLNYDPAYAIITNIEADHLDHYHTEEAFFAAFVQFAKGVKRRVFCCADDPGCARLLEQIPAHGSGYGIGAGEIRAHDISFRNGQTRVNFTWGDKTAALQLPFLGLHNVLNGLAAWAVAVELGVPAETAARGLEHFRGTARRFQLRGAANGVRVIDDYAHHPSEVAAALKQARSATDGKVIVIFQPHLYSRTRNFAQRFAQALDSADAAFVTDIYAAREDPDPSVTPETITQFGKAKAIPEVADAAAAAVALAKPGDIILTMGAGDITNLAPQILTLLES